MENLKIEGTTLVRYTGKRNKVIVPEGITAIGPYAFSESDRASVTSVTKLSATAPLAVAFSLPT